jgi:4-amino-4-deoxy-L-arabinose transferase-like glycosyltransferase
MIQSENQKLLTVVLAALIFTLVLAIIILASVPPVSRDALTHHLAVPKLWIQHGSIYEIPDLPASYYPMNLDLLYTIPLYFGNDIIPKYIHFAFALATAWLIFHYLKARLNDTYALIGVLFFLSTPVIVKLSSTAYVDLGLIFFSTLSVLYLIKWVEGGFRPIYLIVAAVSCGMAIGTKYNGLISFMLLTFMTPYSYLKNMGPLQKRGAIHHQLKAIGYGALFVSIACVVYLPWMAKNYIWTGNPIYPLFNEFVQAKNIDPGKSRLQAQPSERHEIKEAPDDGAEKPSGIDSHFVVRKLVYGETWWETAAIPIRIFFQGQDDNPKFFDGKLNPFLLILPLFVFLRSTQRPGRFNMEIKLLSVYSILFLLFVFFSIDMRIRWISPIIPPLVLLSVFGLSYMKQGCDAPQTKPKTVKLYKGLFWLILTTMFVLNALYITSYFQFIDPISYLSGRTSRDEYIQRFRPEYSAIKHANQNTPQHSVILCLFLGNRRYYSDREMNFDYGSFKTVVKESESPQRVASHLRDRGFTHLMVRHDLFKKWSNDNFAHEEKKKISLFFSLYTETLLSKDGYTLVSLKSALEK